MSAQMFQSAIAETWLIHFLPLPSYLLLPASAVYNQLVPLVFNTKFMKRLSYLFLIPLVLFSQVQLTLAAAQFSDLAGVAGDQLDAITSLSSSGVIKGYGDGTFRPQALISEKEWGLLVSRAIHDQDDTGLTDQPITRLGALYLLSAMWHLDWHQETLAANFSDVYSNSDIQVVNYFSRKGIIHGRSTTEFVPQGMLTRAEAAKVLSLAQSNVLTNGQINQTNNISSSVPLTSAGLQVTQNVVEIIDVSPLNLGPGQTGTLLFTIKNNGDLETGLQEGTDYRVSVLSGDVHVTSVSELGNGLYQAMFQASTNAAAGPVNIQITAFMGTTFHTDINQFLQQRAEAQVSLAQLVPNRLYSNQKAQIIVTPQGIGGSSVTGLDISAEVTHGAGTIIEPVVESPVGSGIYIGTYQATGSGGQDVEITVRVNNLSSRPQTVVTGHIL